MFTVAALRVTQLLDACVQTNELQAGQADVLKVILASYESNFFLKKKPITDPRVNAVCSRYMGRILRSLVLKPQDQKVVREFAEAITPVMIGVLNQQVNIPKQTDATVHLKTYEVQYMMQTARISSSTTPEQILSIEHTLTEFHLCDRKEKRQYRKQSVAVRSYCKLFRALLKCKKEKKHAVGAAYSLEALKKFVQTVYNK